MIDIRILHWPYNVRVLACLSMEVVANVILSLPTQNCSRTVDRNDFVNIQGISISLFRVRNHQSPKC